MTCKDCINYHWCQNNNGCTDFYDTNDDSYTNCSVEAECDGFKDKSEWLHLPCKIGDTMYSCASGVLREVVFKDLFEILCTMVLNDFGKIIFPTKKEAEKALAERNKQ